MHFIVDIDIWTQFKLRSNTDNIINNEVLIFYKWNQQTLPKDNTNIKSLDTHGL